MLNEYRKRETEENREILYQLTAIHRKRSALEQCERKRKRRT